MVTVNFEEFPLFIGQLGESGYVEGEFVVETTPDDWDITEAYIYTGPRFIYRERVTDTDLLQRMRDHFMARPGFVRHVDDLHSEHYSPDEIEARRADHRWMEALS